MKQVKLSYRVCIVQPVVKQYRAEFFHRLQASLRAENVVLRVAYGVLSDDPAKGSDNIELPPGYGVRVNNRWFLGGKVLYQPVLAEIFKADLVIVEQANKHLINPLLIAASVVKLKKVAFWGHGFNRQATKVSLSERMKRKMATLADWWFAYTRGTVEYLTALGMPISSITDVQNSIDTTQFKTFLESVSDAEVASERTRLGLNENHKVAIFCGSLYSDKRLEFLLAACRLIREAVPGFVLLVVGSGPQKNLIIETADQEEWLYYLGPRFGKEKSVYFKMSEIFLCPGLVGLAILDSFAAGLPLITTDIATHSPEIEYLRDGFNGYITEDCVTKYADAVIQVLHNPESLHRLQAGAIESAGKYTVESMVENFTTGVKKCLAK